MYDYRLLDGYQDSIRKACMWLLYKEREGDCLRGSQQHAVEVGMIAVHPVVHRRLKAQELHIACTKT